MIEHIYGRNPVIEVLKSGRVDKLYIQKGNLEGSMKVILGIAKEQKILTTEVNKRKLDELSENGNHQGVVALVSGYEYSTVEDMIRKGLEKIVILDKIEDPHNFGAISRSAEAFGFKGVIIPKHNSVYVNEVVYKTSAGAIENIDVAIETNLTNTIKKLKDEGYWIYGADMEGENYSKADLKGKIVLVIGNEGKGISPLLRKNCDVILSIPMTGEINSLNASCAASILMCEVQRQNAE